MKKCPRCGLPPEGEFECNYCGLVFNDEIENNIFQNKIKNLNWFQLRQEILKWFIILIILFAILAYLGWSPWLMAPIITAILYFSSQANKKSDIKSQLKGAEGKAINKNQSKATKRKTINENLDWLKDRWERVEKEKESGELKSVSYWYFDEATDRQIARIKKNGLKIGGAKLTKGRASDLIGLSEQPNEGSIEILKFFKVPIKGINETRAREEMAKIFLDPEKEKLWKERPATQMQKEFFRFFDLKMPKNLICETASQYISDYQIEHEEEEDKLDEWHWYESIFLDINDPDIRKDYSIKKVSLSVYRQAIEKLKSEGRPLSELSIEFDDVIDKIVEIKPDIQKL